jgi:hypothetical protein
MRDVWIHLQMMCNMGCRGVEQSGTFWWLEGMLKGGIVLEISPESAEYFCRRVPGREKSQTADRPVLKFVLSVVRSLSRRDILTADWQLAATVLAFRNSDTSGSS